MTKEAIRLAYAADFPARRPLSLTTRVQTGPEFSDAVDLIDIGAGETLPQGGLFAYLFRRFGYPNRGSDNHKELATYMLTTTRQDMLMKVTPYAGGDTSLSFTFYVSPEVESAARSWPFRLRDQWWQRLQNWILGTKGIPDWANDCINQNQLLLQPVKTDTEKMQALINSLDILHHKSKGAIGYHSWLDWRKSVITEFHELDPRPADEDFRDADWTKWDEQDPLKPYAAAIVETLADLKRPVWVRDCPITPEGMISDTDVEDDVEYATAAGYPSGDLGNADPELFADVQNAILKLGNGDPIKGLNEALTRLTATSEKEETS